MHSSLWLSALIALPLLGALVAMLVRRREGASYAVAVVVGVIEVALSLTVATMYSSHVASAQGFDFIRATSSRHRWASPTTWPSTACPC